MNSYSKFMQIYVKLEDWHISKRSGKLIIKLTLKYLTKMLNNFSSERKIK